MVRVALFITVLLLGVPAALADEDKEVRTGIAALLEELRTLAQAENRQAIAERFDPDALYDVMLEHGYLADLSTRQREAFRTALRKRLQTSFGRRDLIYPFDRFEIRQLSKLSGAGRYVAYVRLLHDDGTISKQRMSFVRRGSAWRLFDSQDLDCGFSLSSLLGTVYVAAITGTHRDWLKVGRSLNRIVGLLGEGEVDEAEELLAPFLEVDLPRPVAALVQLFMGMIRIVQEEEEEGLEFLARAEALDDDMPVIDFQRATAFNELGRYAEALAAAELYVKRLDRDAQVDFEIARALVGLRRAPEAVPILRRVLAEVPGQLDAVAYLAMALPTERRGELRPHFEAVEDIETTFELMAEICYHQDAYQALGWLTDLFAKSRPDHRDVGYYRGQIHYDKKEYAAAALQFERAQASLAGTDVPDDIREPYYDMYLSSMLEAGKPLAAIEKCIDPAYAFRYLVPELADRGDAPTLAKVMEAGKDLEGVGPWMGYARGASAFLGGDYESAIPLLRAVRKTLAPTPEAEAGEVDGLLYDVEDRLVRCLVRTKKLEDALSLAEWIHERDDDSRYVAIVQAKRGHAQWVRAAIEAAIKVGFDPEALFEDPDLKAMLATDAFKDLRAKHLPKPDR